MAEKDRGDDSAKLFEQAMAEAGHDAYLLVRAGDLFPLYVSGSFEHMFHLPAQRIEDDIEALNRLIQPDSRREIQHVISAWDGQSQLAFCFFYTPDGMGEVLPARCTVDPVHNGTHYLVAFNDARHEEQRVRELENQLSGISNDAQIKADFLNKMSHEIRTPLNGIIGLLGLACARCTDDTEMADDLNQAGELGTYLLSLVNDILDMSRIESGKVELEQKPFDLVAFARDLTSMFEGSAAEKNIAYTVELQDCNDRYLIGDRLRLSQVVVNLISNAIKFTPEQGSVTVTLKEMYRTDNAARLMICVRDTGKGMDPQFLGRIFRPFEQEDASIATTYGGSGLGMAIADSLVTLMGGEIVVDSEVGRGSTFSLYLPFGIAQDYVPDQAESAATHATASATSTEHAAPASAAPAAAEAVRATIAAATPAASHMPHSANTPSGSNPADSPFNGLRVLMAEDNDVNVKITATVLKKLGAQVERARDGKEAVDMFSNHEHGYYDVVLMDIQMPVMNGWDAAQRIREQEGEGPAPSYLH